MLKDSDDDIVFKICVDYGLDPDDADDREMARSSGVFAQWRLAEDMRVLGHELRAQAQRSWVGRMMARVCGGAVMDAIDHLRALVAVEPMSSQRFAATHAPQVPHSSQLPTTGRVRRCHDNGGAR